MKREDELFYAGAMMFLGAVCIVVCAFAIWEPLGWLAAGVALLGFGGVLAS